MHQNDYNWYSTNSSNRFQRTIPAGYPRLEQYSDEGRYVLGKSIDNESARKEFIMSVPEETVEKWADYRREMKEKCLLGKRQLGSLHDESDTTLRTYPEKTFHYEDYDNEQQEGSDEPSWNEYNRSKYVLNRKVPSVSAATSQASPHSTVETDQIFVDDRQPSTSQQARMVISGKENRSHKHVTSSDSGSLHSGMSNVLPDSTVQRPLRESKTVTTEKGSTLIVTVRSTPDREIQECILNKYGHCFAPTLCPFAHNGVVRKVQGKKVAAPDWQRKLPGTPICMGYLNYQCWDTRCGQRHILYPSDTI